MSLYSNECLKSELDLFHIPPTNTSIESGIWVEHQPLSIDSSIDFAIAGCDEYIQLNRTLLQFSVSIVKKVDNRLELINESDFVAPINNLGSSIFKQVEVKLNGTGVEPTNNSYPYKAYLSDLLNYGEDSKNSYLQSSFFYKDTAGEFENLNMVDEVKVENGFVKQKCNQGLLQRRKLVLESAESLEVLTRVYCDIFNSDRYLLNKVNLSLRFILNDPRFFLMHKNNRDYSVKINYARLLTRMVTISPSVMVAHNLALEKATAKYPIKRVTVEVDLIPEKLMSYSTSFPTTTVIPNRIVFGIVENTSYTGNCEKNPFNFKNCNITSVSVKVNRQHANYASELKFDFPKNIYSRGYNTLFDNIDKPVFLTGNNISREEYKNGYTLFAFDLTPDLCSGESFNLLKSGSLTIELTFGTSTDTTHQLIVFQEFDSLIEVNKNRGVSSDTK